MNTKRNENLTQLQERIAQEVDPNTTGYRVEIGDADPIHFDMDNLVLNAKRVESPIPGVFDIGRYRDNGKYYPIVSVLYHKLDPNGDLETDERVIVVTGTGYGVHPGHVGQKPAKYLIGSQIGTCQPGSNGVSLLIPEGRIDPKHFSLDCVVGYRDEPVLANPS